MRSPRTTDEEEHSGHGQSNGAKDTRYPIEAIRILSRIDDEERV